MSVFKRALFRMPGWAKDKITLCDIYKKTVTFTYEGSSAYKSFAGGAVSLCVQL